LDERLGRQGCETGETLCRLASLADLSSMENRRADFRYLFPVKTSLAAECALPDGMLRGTIVDLSVGGMRVRLDPAPEQPDGAGPSGGLKTHAGGAAGIDAALAGQTVEVRFSLGEQTLAIKANVVHVARPHLGLRFLPLVDSTANAARERVLWAYLLEEQPRERRAARAG
jgi:hypothetical protein